MIGHASASPVSCPLILALPCYPPPFHFSACTSNPDRARTHPKAEVYIRFPRAENFDRGRGELFRENERRAQVYIQRPKLPPAKTFDTAETFFRSPGSSCQRHSRWTSCGTRRDPTVTMPGWRCNSFVRTRCSISLLLIGQHLHLVR